MKLFYYCSLVGGFLLGAATAQEAFIPGKDVHKAYKPYAEDFLFNYCIDCHDDVTTKGDLNLLDIGDVDETNAATWKAILEQVAIQEMPPKKKDSPELIERLEFQDWIRTELDKLMENQGGFKAHAKPSKGNLVDHSLLFGEFPEGVELEPTYSPRRLWRVTPEEHITRLNDLINTEPKYDPKKPGVRTHGDAVVRDHAGQLKLYFGVDRITHWGGGIEAYAASVKAIPVVLSNERSHGFGNYAGVASVNSAESEQILSKARDILEYMAYGPKSLIKFPEQITDDILEYEKNKPPGDVRGLPSNLVYGTQMIRPHNPLYELLKTPKETYTDDEIKVVVEFLFEHLTFRIANEEETQNYVDLVQEVMIGVGGENGLIMGLSSLFLDRDSLFRAELAREQEVDSSGRVMLKDWELGLALNHALRYIKPDEQLKKAILEGEMRTKEDVKRELTRMLGDESIRKPRILQFFREYFDYDLAIATCKDEAALGATGLGANAGKFRKDIQQAVSSTDRLVEIILSEDKEVLREMLTTDRVVVSSPDWMLFGKEKDPNDKEELTANQKRVIKEHRAMSERMQEVGMLKDEVKNNLTQKGLSDEEKRGLLNEFNLRKKELRELTYSLGGTRIINKKAVKLADFNGVDDFARVGYNSYGKSSLVPYRKLATVPKDERLGILTHPAWLVSHSDAMDNHAIHRGIWIRKRLLGGGIPDVPITVDAQLPDEPQETLRHRMRVTQEKYCWSCHSKMDPLGLTFEMYNHVGMYREQEKGKPVDTSGEIIDSGDPSLDGPVENAFELIHKLANSERVEQVFVRHAFRFWMGRNETIHDRPVLIAAHKAYRENGGSMNALLISLLTSDAFLYRK